MKNFILYIIIFLSLTFNIFGDDWAGYVPSSHSSFLVLYSDPQRQKTTGKECLQILDYSSNYFKGNRYGLLQLDSSFIAFDGTNDYISFGDVNDIGTNDFMVCVWFKDLSNPNTKSIIADGYTSAGRPCFELFFGGNINTVFFSIRNSSGYFFTSHAISENTYYFLVGMKHGSSIKLYVNSVLEDSVAYTVQTLTNTHHTTIGTNNADGSPGASILAEIGPYFQYIFSGSAPSDFKDAIDEIWNGTKSRYGY